MIEETNFDRYKRKMMLLRENDGNGGVEERKHSGDNVSNSLDSCPLTKAAIEEAKKKNNNTGLTDEVINKLYDIYRKEYFRFELLKALREAGTQGNDDELKEKYGLTDEIVKDENVSFEELIKKVQTVDSEEETPVSEGEEEESDPWMDNIISRVQNNEPIVQKTETPSVMYPDVVDSEPEPEVAPAIPHFEKISHADKDGFTRADDQWIDSKMTLLRKRGII